MENFMNLIHDTPFWDEVYGIRAPNHKLDLRPGKVKRCP